MTQLVTAGETKKKETKTKKCATPWDAYSSTPGERSTIPYYSVKDFTCTSNFSDAGVAAAANMVAAQADAAGAPMGDAVDDRVPLVTLQRQELFIIGGSNGFRTGILDHQAVLGG